MAGNKINIISGRYKGRPIIAPGAGTHPMGARERNALFNRLEVADARVLDLFAGSGALGLEALSRGAREATFVEKSPAAARIISTNLSALGLSMPVHTCSVRAFLERYSATFDLILLDPPYSQFAPSGAAALRSGSAGAGAPAEPSARAATPRSCAPAALLSDLALSVGRLAPCGRLALSSPASLPAPELPGLALLSSHTYAAARLSIYAHLNFVIPAK